MSAEDDAARRVVARVAARIAEQVEYASAADGDTLRTAALEGYDAVRYAAQRLAAAKGSPFPTQRDYERAAAAVRAGAEVALMEAGALPRAGRASQAPTRPGVTARRPADPDKTPVGPAPPPGRLRR